MLTHSNSVLPPLTKGQRSSNNFDLSKLIQLIFLLIIGIVTPMKDCDFSGLENYHQQQLDDPRPPLRSYHAQLRQKRSEFDDYELKQTIGEGGFGKVKKATHRPTGEVVAVKIMRMQQYEQQQAQAIQRQIQSQKNLMHENIAQIYEVIKRENKIYIFMEFCKNGELFDKINRTGPMPEEQAARIFHQILAALLYLRESGLSHRDIKPENVLFDDHWNVKLIDFGFSCASKLGEMRRTVCGTPSYTPPEIIKKQPYDPQLVDVWCLGVVLYAMLTAQLPFQGQTPQQRKGNIVSCNYRLQAILSSKSQRLFTSIFVQARFRIRLWQLRTSEFALAYQPAKPHFINFKSENLVLQQGIVDILERQYHMDSQKVTESVRGCKLDKYHAMYYLTIRHEKHTHRHPQISHLDQFKKQRKGSILKLDPIRVSSISRNRKSQSKQRATLGLKASLMQHDGIIKMRVRKEPNTCRLRISDTSDSPIRLLDCLANYKQQCP